MRIAMFLVLVVAGCSEVPLTPVGVTLEDGQTLVGDITTEHLRLTGGLGTVIVPLDDVGVVMPVEGYSLDDAGGQVTVWLRNGSELRGRWADPELRVEMHMGGDLVAVDVPMGDVQAVQTQGSEIWPDLDVYRVRTTHGDDFVVDPEQTRLVLDNELGTFAPYLSECRSARPIADPAGDWRIELNTGTVLVGPLAQDSIAFAMPMGPGQMTVPLDLFVSLDREYWVQHGAGGESSAATPDPDRRPKARPALSSGDGWFDYEEQWEAKH